MTWWITRPTTALIPASSTSGSPEPTDAHIPAEPPAGPAGYRTQRTKEFSMADVEIKKGLDGVVVDYTAVSKVNPDTNSLLYRGYPVQELAASCSFEEVAFLLWNGELPSSAELSDFT